MRQPGEVDWIVVTRPPGESQTVEMSASTSAPHPAAHRGSPPRFSAIPDFSREVTRLARVPWTISSRTAAAPDKTPASWRTTVFRWSGWVVPPARVIMRCRREPRGRAMWVNEQLLFDDLTARSNTINRGAWCSKRAGCDVAVGDVHRRETRDANCSGRPRRERAGGRDSDRARETGGDHAVILDRAETWMDILQPHTAVKYTGSFRIERRGWADCISSASTRCSRICREHGDGLAVSGGGAQRQDPLGVVAGGRGTRRRRVALLSDVAGHAWESSPAARAGSSFRLWILPTSCVPRRQREVAASCCATSFIRARPAVARGFMPRWLRGPPVPASAFSRGRSAVPRVRAFDGQEAAGLGRGTARLARVPINLVVARVPLSAPVVSWAVAFAILRGIHVSVTPGAIPVLRRTCGVSMGRVVPRLEKSTRARWCHHVRPGGIMDQRRQGTQPADGGDAVHERRQTGEEKE